MATPNLSGYIVGGGAAGGYSNESDDDSDDKKGYKTLAVLKSEYLNYLGQKRSEIDEQQDARRYRHGSHWTSDQLEQLKKRRQPASYENIVGRKIHGVVGTMERLRQDPKAFARTPKHEQGAELATGAIRYCLDTAEWSAKDPICTEAAAVDGIGGIEIVLEQGDANDKEIGLEIVDTDSFFYDPVSFRHDFSDARYMGVGKWIDLETAKEMFPDKAEELDMMGDVGAELTTDSDREQKWYNSDDDIERVRVVDHWYRHKGGWCYCIYTGSFKLSEGKSFLKDEKGNDTCKYVMFSAYIDQDGDRYGLVRDLKPLNQEVDMRKSKALYTMLSRRIIAERGAFDDVEIARREAARSDGVVIRNKGFEADFDDTGRVAETEAQFKFYELARTALESFGPNMAVAGQNGLENSSGRAIQLLQQAGLADLGPFIQSYRGWKIRLYRTIWNAVQQHWTGERWIRVTDDDDISQFIQINGVEIDPQTGHPTLVNALGSLDVDIILDEGPDSVTQMGDAYDTLTALAQKGAEIPPAILIELSPLPQSVKKKLMEMINPSEPDPKQQMQEQLEMKMAQAEVAEKEMSAMLKKAQAMKAQAEAAVVQPEQAEMGDAPDHPMKVQSEAMEKQASAEQKMADAKKKMAEIEKIYQDIALEPQRLAMEQQAAQQKMHLDAQKLQVDAQNKAADREANQQQAMADRQLQAKQAQTQAKQSAKDSDRNFQVSKMKAKQKPAPKGK